MKPNHPKNHNAPLQVVVGLGKTGLSCVRYLVNQGYTVAVTDSRESPPGLIELQQEFPQVPYSLGQFDEKLCAQADTLIISPGVSLQEPVIANQIAQGTPAIGDIELFARHAKAPIAAITGSNGKSTVTALVGEMAECAQRSVQVGGNLGTPALDLLNAAEPDLYVLELSSFQLETTYSLKAAAATVLNISEDHMDRYQNLNEYLTAKQRIYQNCIQPIINRDDPLSWQALHFATTPLSFGFDVPAAGQFGLRQTSEGEFFAYGDQLLLKTTELKIKGRHQLANALAALAMGHAMNLPMPAMLQALKQFEGLPHRCQWIMQYRGVDWYNDSKATNVGAAQAAIEGLGAHMKGKLIVIGGGIGKNADFSPLRATMQTYVRLLILIGQDADQMETALKNSTQIIRAKTLENAVEIARLYAQSGDAVILAPACASFDMFRNFEHRGEVFMEIVRSLV